MSTKELRILEGDSPSGASEVALSARQSLFWLDEQLFPGAHYGNLVLTVALRGALDVERFSEAWAGTVRSSDALRMVLDPQRAVQRNVPAEPPPLAVVPVGLDDLQGWIAEHAVLPLVRGEVPWEAALLRVGPEHHVFHLAQFHAITDGLSAMLLVEELADRYEGRIPAPAASFREYLQAEAEYRASPAGERDRAYWTRALGEGTPPLRPYGLVRRDRSTAVERSWIDAPALGARLGELARREPFATVSEELSRLLVLATGFAAYLYRVTGNRQILLGIPVANRSNRFARTRGLLMEQPFLKLRIEEGDSFAALARRARSEAHAALVHGRWCVSNRGLDYATVNLAPAPPGRFADLEARVRLDPAPTLQAPGAGQGDLRETMALWVENRGEEGLRLALDLHRGTFDEGMRRRARLHLLRVLEALTANPDTALDSVDLLGEEEGRAVLAAGRGEEPGGIALDVVEAVAAQARRRPDHLAVSGPDLALPYAELERLSNRLARRLRSMGVVRGARVAVAVPRGAGELVSLLAVLKAGGAYVPLDPSHPVERVQVILEDAAPEVLIAPSSSPLRAAMPSGTALLALDDLVRAAEGFDDAPLGEACEADQVAYILFTSGSTGRPKGVEVPRGAFANFLRSMKHTPGMAEGDRLLAVTTTTFDIAGLELFLPLSVGATVVIADRDSATDPRRLRQLLEQGGITVMQATPATWRLLVEAGWEGDGRVRLLCGGEALSFDLAAKLLARGGELWNLYGPTETTVWSTVERVRSGEGSITIGRPIDWTQIYVLDAALRPVPEGVIGEIVIGGAGVALGYRGRPELTAERFLPDPFGPPGARLYRTGDLGRLLEDGRLECLGRVDHQVKIRGFRIELGEIEAVLRGAPGVKDAVVVADPSAAGDPRLVAYWVGEADRDALYQRARAKLPPYMIPAAYVPLAALPLTPSGKVDRRALPRAGLSPLRREVARLPEDGLQIRVAALWAELLDLPAVGVDEDFFELGGTSLLAVQARDRLEHELGVELPLRVLFETPTVEGILRQIGKPNLPDEPIVVPLRRGKAGVPPLFCLRGVDQYMRLAQALGGDRPVIGLHVPVGDTPGVERLPAIGEVARRYVEIIRRQQVAGPYHLVGLCLGGIIAYEAARQLEEAGEEVALVGIFDGILPRGMRFSRTARLAEGMRRFIADPTDFGERMARQLRSLALLGIGADGRADLSIDGLDLEKELVRRYQDTVGRLRGHLVVFRADNRRWPAGTIVAPDLGWAGAAERVSVHGLATEHLDLLREPSVRAVARALARALQEVGEGAKVSVQAGFNAEVVR